MARVLVTGATGRLGAYLMHELSRVRAHEVVAWSSPAQPSAHDATIVRVDLTDHRALKAAFAIAAPDIVIHTAAVSVVTECAADPERAKRVNVDATRMLAQITAGQNARFVHCSTDMVFDGDRGMYREEDAPSPVSVYGMTKAEAERHVLDTGTAIVIRVAHLFGPARGARTSFFDHLVSALRAGTPITLFTDEWRTPLDFPTAARAILDVAAGTERGLLHLAGVERLTRWDMGLRVAESLDLSTAPLRQGVRADMADGLARPRDVSLDASRARALLPAIEWHDFLTACQRLAGSSSSAGT